MPLHPTQLYLCLMNVAIFLVAAWLFSRRRFDGQALCVTMLMYAVGRFPLEFLRGDDVARGGCPQASDGAGYLLSTSQWFSLGAFVLGALPYMRWRQGSITPVTAPAASRSSTAT